MKKIPAYWADILTNTPYTGTGYHTCRIEDKHGIHDKVIIHQCSHHEDEFNIDWDSVHNIWVYMTLLRYGISVLADEPIPVFLSIDGTAIR